VKDLLGEGDAWLQRQVSPSLLLVAGLILVPAIVLQHDLLVKAAQAVFFLLLALAAVSRGRRRMVTAGLIFVATTVVANLVFPAGRVLLQLGPLRVTQGALEVGLSKALTLVCLVFLSRFFIRSTLSFPGAAGRYLSKTLQYLNSLLENGRGLAGRDMIGRLDRLLDTIYCGPVAVPVPVGMSGTVPGLVILGSLLALNWSLVLVGWG
jgi:hypothetical protein